MARSADKHKHQKRHVHKHVANGNPAATEGARLAHRGHGFGHTKFSDRPAQQQHHRRETLIFRHQAGVSAQSEANVVVSESGWNGLDAVPLCRLPDRRHRWR